MSTLQVLVPAAFVGFGLLVALGLYRAADRPEPRPPELDRAPR